MKKSLNHPQSNGGYYVVPFDAVSGPTWAAGTIAVKVQLPANVPAKFINLTNGQPMPLHSLPAPHVPTLTPMAKALIN
ncbi:hypothetical protein TSUD_227150 [Trifolium subterraneum]|uniref:Uncharacterized protein n=1 Tax=Trifolium subterraneum TaxID=3900 RepID=A0A2Z6N094_TRISU|nr:hypothetical protein TSUD_227150 [Trifolium subterraneum]